MRVCVCMCVRVCVCVRACVLAEDAYEREYRERRERRERELREREQRDKLTAAATDKVIELTDKEKELEQMKVGSTDVCSTSSTVHSGAGKMHLYSYRLFRNCKKKRLV